MSWVCHVPRRTNMKNTKLSLHILKFDASMSCESQTNVTKSFMKQFLQIIKTQLYYLRLQYPVDLCMIIMLFLLCPYSSYRPWNPAVPGAPCRWSSRWCGCGTSLGVQWESSQACMWQSLTMLLIITILLSIPFLYLLCQHIPIWSSPPPWTPFWFFPSLL